MDNLYNINEPINGSIARLNALAAELNEIRSVNETTVLENQNLLEQIAVCESRHGYVRDALAESEKIAREITRNAELRVDKIMSNAERVLIPQQEHIARLDKEILELTEEIRSKSAKAPETGLDFIDVSLRQREFSLREPQYLDLDDDKPQTKQNIVSERQPEVRREFSMRKPQEWDIDAINELNHPKLEEYFPRTSAPIEEPLPPSIANREFSLRVPQEPDIVTDDLRAGQEEIKEQPRQFFNPTETDLPEIKIEDISNYNLAMSLMEQNESDMHLDVFVDTRYVATSGEKVGQMQRHSWQVKILVEAPSESQKFVGYGKVSSAVTSTLLRFDDVVLNDVYPFGIIAPNLENIAMYFYNCLQDTLSVMDLKLKEINIWENQNLVQEVKERNTAIDDKLQKGDDILHDIRSLLVARDGREEKTNSRGRLGNIFRNM